MSGCLGDSCEYQTLNIYNLSNVGRNSQLPFPDMFQMGPKPSNLVTPNHPNQSLRK